jgi:2-dehydro-3-deoxyglucarate aldolase/4-hydroxy-2-oxoheptanedioate aldolase
LFGIFMFSASPFLAEVVARSGVDWVLVDLEHGTADESDLLPMFLAIEQAGCQPLVRVESGERIRVGRALDLGARGVMVPQMTSVADAGAMARWMRTQPEGERGIALYTRGMGFGVDGHEGARGMHEELLSIVQIETRSALDQVEQIAALDGVDVLFVGPADLSHALGIPGQLDHPDFVAAVERVAAAALGHGKAAGIIVSNPQDVGGYARKGFTFLALSIEASILDEAAHEALRTAREAIAEAIAPGVV